MAKGISKPTIPDEIIISKIYLIRDKKVMLDEDLAELYGVTTWNLNKAVNRNIARFPDDFMFQVTKEEFDNLIFQIGTSSWGGPCKLPYIFTEQGMAILMCVFIVNIKGQIQILMTSFSFCRSTEGIVRRCISIPLSFSKIYCVYL